MAVTVANIGSVVTATATTTIDTTAPSGSGGTLVLFVSSAISTTPTTPTGWTQRATAINSSNVRITVWDRQSDGGADDSPTVTVASSTNIYSLTLRLAGVDASSFDNAQTTQDNSIDTTGDIPGFTVAENDSLQLVGVTGTAAAINNCTYNSPVTQIVTGTGRLSIAEAARNAGTIGADTFTIASGARKSVATLIYKPAAGGGTSALLLANAAHFARQL